MSTKCTFLTHDSRNVGKKTNNLPMIGETCHQNGCFWYTFDTSCTRNGDFGDMLKIKNIAIDCLKLLALQN